MSELPERLPSSRQQFESFVTERGLPPGALQRKPSGEYEHVSTQLMLEIWELRGGIMGRLGIAAADPPTELSLAEESAVDHFVCQPHVVSVGFERLPFEGIPQEWLLKNFANIEWFECGSDNTLVLSEGWQLSADQSRTVLGDFIALYQALKVAGKSPES